LQTISSPVASATAQAPLVLLRTIKQAPVQTIPLVLTFKTTIATATWTTRRLTTLPRLLASAKTMALAHSPQLLNTMLVAQL